MKARPTPSATRVASRSFAPAAPSAEEDPRAKEELADMRRRFVLGALLTAPLFFLGMSELIPGDPIRQAIGSGRLGWLELALATPVVLWAGRVFFVRAIES